MKKKISVILLVLLILLSCGCTKYINEGKKRVTNEITGQSLTSNILCKPESKDLVELYKKYDSKLTVKMEKLPTCSNFKMGSLKYESLWETIFVKPLAFIILKVGDLVNNYGLSVMIIGILIRLLMLPLSKNMIKQSENMKKAQPEINKIEKKYKDKTDSESMMAKSQETMMIYKKYNINPITGCITSFVQLPLFFAFLEAINRVPAIFEENLLHLQLGTTPLKGITNGNYIYIALILLIVVTTYFSMKGSLNTSSKNKDENNPGIQMQFMTKIMVVMISVASLSLPAAIALYWISTNAFACIQNYIVKKRG